MADRPVVLVGLMGSGKTSVGSRLSEALGRPLRDSDDEIERRYGASAAEQYRRRGADVLHAREADALRDALAERPAPVIAAAASVVEDAACRAALADAYVVWLDARPGVLADRVRADRAADATAGEDDHRPRYRPDLEAMLTAQHERRAARFREVADLVVDVSDTTVDKAAETVLAALAGGARS